MHLPNTRWSDRFFFFLAVGSALFALFMHVGIATTQVSRSQWSAPAKFLRTQWKPGDVVAFLPHWALKAAEQLRGLPTMYAEHVEQEDLSRYRRLWVLVAPRLGKWWFRRSFQGKVRTLKKRYWHRKSWSFGKVELLLFQLPKPRSLLFDFGEKKRLRQAEVGLETPASNRTQAGCRRNPVGHVEWLKGWRADLGWHTGRRGYFFGNLIQEVGDTPRDCLWAHLQRCKVLKVRYRNVPLRGELQIQHGFTTAAPRGIAPSIRPGGPDVLFSVWINNRLAKQVRLTERQRWRTHWLRLDSLGSLPKEGSVEFRIQTPQRRHHRAGYCFRAELRALEVAPPSAPTPSLPPHVFSPSSSQPPSSVRPTSRPTAPRLP